MEMTSPQHIEPPNTSSISVEISSELANTLGDKALQLGFKSVSDLIEYATHRYLEHVAALNSIDKAEKSTPRLA